MIKRAKGVGHGKEIWIYAKRVRSDCSHSQTVMRDLQEDNFWVSRPSGTISKHSYHHGMEMAHGESRKFVLRHGDRFGVFRRSKLLQILHCSLERNLQRACPYCPVSTLKIACPSHKRSARIQHVGDYKKRDFVIALRERGASPPGNPMRTRVLWIYLVGPETNELCLH